MELRVLQGCSSLSSTPDVCQTLVVEIKRVDTCFLLYYCVSHFGSELFQGETWLPGRWRHMYLAPLFVASGEGSVLISAIEAILDTRLSQSLVALSHFSVARMPYDDALH